MKVSLIQCNLEWEGKEANLRHISGLLPARDSGTDLVVLPEMFSTGFSMNRARLAETMKGDTVGWMKMKSLEGGFALCGSLIIEEEGRYYNRLVFVTPDGSAAWYDKRHLHSMSGEDEAYSKGNKRVVYSYLDFSFNFQICYDLRFPVWSRNRGDTDVIIYSANWPAVRSNVWKTLLVARAIENQCYVIGVNRVGVSPDGTAYSGDSLVAGPRGDILGSAEPGREGVISAVLGREQLDKLRDDMPVWRDADRFTVDI